MDDVRRSIRDANSRFLTNEEKEESDIEQSPPDHNTESDDDNISLK